MRRGFTDHPDQPLDRGKLALLVELGAEQLDPQVGEIVLRAQHVDKLGAPQAVTRNTGPQQRLALRQQLRADQIGRLAAAGEVGCEFPELALDLQLLRLPARLRGANLGGGFALLRLMQAPLQRHAQTDLGQITVRAVAGAVDRAGLQRHVRIPALVGELLAGGGRGDLRVTAGEGRIARTGPLHQGIRCECGRGGQSA